MCKHMVEKLFGNSAKKQNFNGQMELRKRSNVGFEKVMLLKVSKTALNQFRRVWNRSFNGLHFMQKSRL